MKKIHRIIKHTNMALAAWRQIIGGGAPNIKNRRWWHPEIDGSGSAARSAQRSSAKADRVLHNRVGLPFSSSLRLVLTYLCDLCQSVLVFSIASGAAFCCCDG